MELQFIKKKEKKEGNEYDKNIKDDIDIVAEEEKVQTEIGMENKEEIERLSMEIEKLKMEMKNYEKEIEKMKEENINNLEKKRYSDPSNRKRKPRKIG